MENNENDQGSISLSTKCQQLRKPLVVVSLVVVSSDNLISLAWMSDLEMKNFIFLWTATGLALNMLVTMGIPLKNRRIIQIWLCIQGIYQALEFFVRLNLSLFRRISTFLLTWISGLLLNIFASLIQVFFNDFQYQSYQINFWGIFWSLKHFWFPRASKKIR